MENSFTVNHFKITFEYNIDFEGFQVYFEWIEDDTHFQYLGFVKTEEECEELKKAMQLLNVKR